MPYNALMVGILAGARQGHILQQFDRVSDGIDVVDVLQRIRDDLHPGQLAFVDDQDTSILGVSAGYGAGKTRALCAKAVHLAMANQGFIGVVMEPTGPLIRDIWQSDFDDFLETYDIPYTFRASPLPEYTLHLPGGDTKILGRLRSGNVRQFAAASTPEGFRWMWQTFASDDGKGREDRRLIRMRTQDNPHLPPDFIERMQANYDPQLLKAYLDGEFVNLTTGQVYDRFDRVKHVTTQVPDISREPLRIGVDFNVGNMSAVIAIRAGKSLYVVDEVSGAHDTDALAQKIKAHYPDHKIYIYPDASGGNRSTNATQTDIAILESYGMSNQSPKANPPVRDRVAAVQALLENGKGEVRLKIAASCVKMIEGLELQSYTEKGDPDKDAGYDHMNDALGYLIWREFNPLHAGAGRGTGIRLY